MTRAALLVCLCLLAVCLILAIGSLAALQKAVRETEAIREDAAELVAELDARRKLLETEDQPVGVTLPEAFCLRESGGKIGVYTVDGVLIRILDVDVSTLPKADRLSLQEGISVTSWSELMALIQDYA